MRGALRRDYSLCKVENKNPEDDDGLTPQELMWNNVCRIDQNWSLLYQYVQPCEMFCLIKAVWLTKIEKNGKNSDK